MPASGGKMPPPSQDLSHEGGALRAVPRIALRAVPEAFPMRRNGLRAVPRLALRELFRNIFGRCPGAMTPAGG